MEEEEGQRRGGGVVELCTEGAGRPSPRQRGPEPMI